MYCKRISSLDAKIGTVDAKLDAHRAETAAHRAETAKAFADLDRELAGQVEVHNRIDARLATPAARRAPKRRAKR
jgi:hypothetical protein